MDVVSDASQRPVMREGKKKMVGGAGVYTYVFTRNKRNESNYISFPFVFFSFIN